jgi:hypothetical protein
MIWGRVPYDRPIRHGMTQCRAFITTERDGYFCGANDDFASPLANKFTASHRACGSTLWK